MAHFLTNPPNPHKPPKPAAAAADVDAAAAGPGPGPKPNPSPNTYPNRMNAKYLHMPCQILFHFESGDTSVTPGFVKYEIPCGISLMLDAGGMLPPISFIYGIQNCLLIIYLAQFHVRRISLICNQSW